MTSVSHGFATQNSYGEEGRKEEQGREHLQHQACADAGGALPQKSNRYVYFENSSNRREPLFVEEVGTVDELFAKIVSVIPQLNHEDLGMRISATRSGTLHRVFLTKDLPSDAPFLYLSLYLKRHPPLDFRKN